MRLRSDTRRKERIQQGKARTQRLKVLGADVCESATYVNCKGRARRRRVRALDCVYQGIVAADPVYRGVSVPNKDHIHQEDLLDRSGQL